MKKPRAVQIEDRETGQKMSLTAFKKQMNSDLEEKNILASKIVTNKILTKKEIETLISQNVLKTVSVKGKLYITRNSLEEYMIFQKISKKINS